MSIEYKELLNTDDVYFSNAIEIYLASFPSNERQPLPVIKKRVDRRQSKLNVGISGNEVVCIAFIWEFNNSEFVLLDYMAVAESYRNQKIGGTFFKFLIKKVRSQGKYLLLEVEDASFGNNTDERKKRINFYIRNGAYVLEDIPYLLPSLDNTLPTEMSLMIAPKYERDQIEKDKIENLIKRLYLELYGKKKNDIGLNTILKQIPDKIKFLNKIFQ